MALPESETVSHSVLLRQRQFFSSRVTDSVFSQQQTTMNTGRDIELIGNLLN